MFTGYQRAEELTQNLMDAGCSEEMIAQLLSCLLCGNKGDCLCQLEELRSGLLEDIHREKSGIEYLNELLGSLR